MKDRLARLSVVFANFSALENRLSECLDFLPYTKENWHVVSPRFAPIILDACSLTDSIFRQFANLSDKRAPLKRLAMEVENKLELESAISLFIIDDLKLLNPFVSWKTKVPEWWTAYNLLKYDRLNHYNKATYENAVLALCALHQVIARNRDFIPNLISAGWFNSDDPEYSELILGQQIQIGVKPIHIMPVASRLFVSPLHSNFVEFKKGHPWIIDEVQFSPRITSMLSAVWCIEAGEYEEIKPVPPPISDSTSQHPHIPDK